MNPFIGYGMGMNGGGILAFIAIILWSIFWKIAALWIASKNDQKKWFIALAVVNTIGILEIIYIFQIAKKKWADVTEFYSSINK